MDGGEDGRIARAPVNHPLTMKLLRSPSRCGLIVSTEEPKAPRVADKSNSKAYTTVVTSVLTISERMALLLDSGCVIRGQMVGPHASR